MAVARVFLLKAGFGFLPAVCASREHFVSPVLKNDGEQTGTPFVWNICSACTIYVFIIPCHIVGGAWVRVTMACPLSMSRSSEL